MDRAAWQVTVHGVAKEWDVTYWLNNNKPDKIIKKLLKSLNEDKLLRNQLWKDCYKTLENNKET